MLKRFYSKMQGSENSKGSDITFTQRLKLKTFYIALSKPFVGKGIGSDDNKTYTYQLDKGKVERATLSQIVEGINTFQMRSTITNEVDPNPSISITSTNSDEVILYDTAAYQFIAILHELKTFINDELLDKTFNGASVMEISLYDLINNIPERSKVPRTPQRSNKALPPDPASLGGRHTKRHHRTKRHHTKRVKRSKRSKHTRRRKH